MVLSKCSPSSCLEHHSRSSLLSDGQSQHGQRRRAPEKPFLAHFHLPRCSWLHLSLQSPHSQKMEKVPAPTTANLFQETPYLSALVGETRKKTRGGAGWHLHATFWTTTSLKPLLQEQTHSCSTFPLASRLPSSLASTPRPSNTSQRGTRPGISLCLRTTLSNIVRTCCQYLLNEQRKGRFLP